MKIGAVTIGQSPRVDVTPDIMPIFGTGRADPSRCAGWA